MRPKNKLKRKKDSKELGKPPSKRRKIENKKESPNEFNLPNPSNLDDFNDIENPFLPPPIYDASHKKHNSNSASDLGFFDEQWDSDLVGDEPLGLFDDLNLEDGEPDKLIEQCNSLDFQPPFSDENLNEQIKDNEMFPQLFQIDGQDNFF